MPALTTTTALLATLCIAATTHNEARNQNPQAQRAVICTIINNTPTSDSNQHDQHNAAPALCTTSANPKLFTSNRPRNFLGRALVSSIPTSHKAQTVRIPRSDFKAYLKALRLAARAVENPQTFCKGYPYHYFNNAPLGKRYPTPLKAVKIGDLLFY